MRRTALCLLAVHGALCMQNVAAQSMQPMTTERPSFSSSAYVLSQGTWQFESGYHYTSDSDGADFEQHTLPQALLRYAVSDGIELQFGWPGRSWRDSGSDSSNGINDATLRLKIRAADEDAATPVAFFAELALPVGDDGFTRDSYEPTIGAVWAHSRYFGTVLIAEVNDDYVFGSGLGMGFVLSNDRSAYAEWQALLPEHGGPLHSLNVGILWVRRGNMQLDLNASLGLNDRAADFSVGAGFAYRF